MTEGKPASGKDNIGLGTITKVVVENEAKTNEARTRHLVLFNDDLVSFENVIRSLIEICEHTSEQAEQCAFIAHSNGKCSIKEGSYIDLKPMKDALAERGLSITIE